jgi:hypothetical protein
VPRDADRFAGDGWTPSGRGPGAVPAALSSSVARFRNGTRGPGDPMLGTGLPRASAATP